MFHESQMTGMFSDYAEFVVIENRIH
jgi:hypothetical protein